MWGRRSQTETEGDVGKLPFWLITCCVIFKAPLSTSSAFRSGVLNRKPAAGRCPNGAPSLSLVRSMTDRIPSGCKLRLTVSHVSMCIYHFTTPTHFRSTTWLSSVKKNLWLSAQLMVNMQHYVQEAFCLKLTLGHILPIMQWLNKYILCWDI